MFTPQAITLFDLRSTLAPQAWSPHVWRTRLVLNYKRLPHATEWVAFPDLSTVLSVAGASPTRENDPKYSVPAIIDAIADPPIVLSDSTVIADYLEKTYPEPSIYPHGREAQMGYTAAIVDYIIMRMAFMVIPSTSKILPARDAEYFVNSRKSIFALDVKDMVAASAEEEDRRWKALEEGLAKVSALADGIDHGDRWLFGTAHVPGYADFVMVAALIWFRHAGPEGGWERLANLHGGKWRRFVDNAGSYMQVL